MRSLSHPILHIRSGLRQALYPVCKRPAMLHPYTSLQNYTRFCRPEVHPEYPLKVFRRLSSALCSAHRFRHLTHIWSDTAFSDTHKWYGYFPRNPAQVYGWWVLHLHTLPALSFPVLSHLPVLRTDFPPDTAACCHPAVSDNVTPDKTVCHLSIFHIKPDPDRALLSPYTGFQSLYLYTSLQMHSRLLPDPVL